MDPHKGTEQKDDRQDLQILKRRRAILKGQISRAHHRITNNTAADNVAINEIEEWLASIREIWERFDRLQDEIDLTINEDDVKLQAETEYRDEVQDIYRATVATLKELKRQTVISSVPAENKSRAIMAEAAPTSLITSSINFAPLHDEETFTNFIRRLEVFLLLKENTDPSMKTYTLLHALTPQLHQKLYDICAPSNPRDMLYEELIRMLKDYLDPQPSVWARQHKFICRIQERDETITEFSTELKRLTTNCEFNCSCGESVANMFLRLQFIRGLKDSDIRTRLLQEEKTKSFKEVVGIATSMELAKAECILMQEPKSLQQIETKTIKPKSRIGSGGKFIRTFDTLRGRCYRCGSAEHRANECHFASTTCTNCKKKGHIARVCQSKPDLHSKQVRLIECEMAPRTDPNKELYEINLLSGQHSDKITIHLLIEGTPIEMELDTGSAVSAISYADFLKLNTNKKILKTHVRLRTYSQEIIEPKGVVLVKCSYNDREFVGKLYIIDLKVAPIFGREWLHEVRLNWEDVKLLKTQTKTKLEDLLTEYKDVFKEGIGTIQSNQGHLRLKEGAKPIFIKPRQIPYAIKNTVEKELDRLESNGIISKVEYSEWGTPIVPVVKPNGSVRICADYKVTLNKVIKDEHFPIPCIDDIYAEMSGGKCFSVLDLSNAYLHLPMDEESAKMQTLSTHKGVYKVNRLMFGVKVAPAIWNRFMAMLLQGINGVQSFFDDIIIQGSTEDELLSRLRIVLQRLKDNDLRLNRDKCKFLQSSITYLGHRIDQNGLHKTEEKIKAITNCKRPENVNQLRTFLGLANYYNKFIPNLATMLAPLNRLLQKGRMFKWTKTCDEGFNKVKQTIVNDNVLVHFDPTLPLVLATDASPVGLGAALSHRYPDGSERPIAFASRTLTKSEQNYSQIDKEATAIFWGLKKFFSYCYGRKFVLVTDHKPLVSIFHPEKTLPSISATRIFNYAHFLAGFDYTIEYRNTNKHCNADFLSRNPIEQVSLNWTDDHAHFQISQLQALPVDSRMIAKETAADNTLKPLLDALTEGQSLETLGYHDNEFTLQDRCLFKGVRVVIPQTLRRCVLDELHIGHLGINKMKALARSYCYWKGIDTDIEQLVKACRSCCLKRNAPPKAEPHPWERPSGPWQRLHIDFAEPTVGNHYFIVVDAYTKWVEVVPTKTTTSSWCIKQLRQLFATFGLPLVLVSDNGRQFVSREFEQFLTSNGIVHKKTAPYHPATNGQAERFVQTVKKSLTAMEDSNGDFQLKLSRLLMQLRRTPNSTGESAYSLMFNRKIRTRLDMMLSGSEYDNKEHWSNKDNRKREFEVGDRVQARDYSNDKDKWKFGKVLTKDGLVHYTIMTDNGDIWRRHVDQLLASDFRGES